MSHEVETMAYAGELPWHGLGVKVADNLSPEEIMIAAGLNWTTSKKGLFFKDNGVKVPVNDFALVRDSDNTVFDVVSGNWKDLDPSHNGRSRSAHHDVGVHNCRFGSHLAGYASRHGSVLAIPGRNG